MYKITASDVRDVVDGHGVSALVQRDGVAVASTNPAFKDHDQSNLLITQEDARDMVRDDEWNEEGNITDSGAQRIADELNADENIWRRMLDY